MRVQIVAKISDENFASLVCVRQDGTIHAEHDGSQSAALELFPYVAWRIEAGRLEEEHEADPLVVLVIDALLAGPILVHSRIRHIYTHRLVPRVHHRESGMDPAVGVEQVGRDVVARYTIDGVAEVLS